MATAKEVVALLHAAEGEELLALIERYEQDGRSQVAAALSRAKRRLAHDKAEAERVHEMYLLQEKLADGGIAIGIDEVGRGALAGPLTVCACALPMEPEIAEINDSKQLTPAKRELLAEKIQDSALALGIYHVEPHEIDKIGMAQAIRKAMLGALTEAEIEPDAVLIDGNPLHIHEREKTIVKGDAKVASIAAASIVAKVTRDELMRNYEIDYPGYSFAESKGYGSAAHIQAIKERGLCPIHRVSFCGNFLENMTLF